ncbi:MAG: hypothetical protein LBK73_15440 [Treponema sp.]|jgi:hypothetical protein|nr:hypothetical protein [Treponema sp.]
MKKALYLSVATALLFAMILAGCDGAQDIFQERDYAAIPGPKNLKATPLRGINVISWDVEKDARAGYTVVRKDTVTGEPRTFTTSQSQPYYVDRVGFDNLLVDKRKYTYTVVANSGTDLNLRNGSSSVDVTATIPLRTDADVVAAPEEADIEFAPTADGKRLAVIWNAKEYIGYSAFYTIGDGTVPFTITDTEQTSEGNVSLLKRQTVPLVGGKTTVKITAKWDSNDYYASDEVSKSYDGTTTLLPNVASYDYNFGDPKGFYVEQTASNIYTIKWDAINGATDGGAGYDIWKAEVKSGDSPSSLADGTLTLGDWTPVATTSASKNGNTYTLIENISGEDTSKTYIYGIIAKNSAAKSSSLTTYIVYAITQSIATTFTSANIVETKDADGKPQLTINVDVADGEAVTLARATVTIADGIPSVGAYTAVTGGTSVGARYTWIDKPAIRDSYNYKLTVTKGGVSKDIVVEKNNGSYTSSLESYITVSTQAAPANVYSIKISLSGSLAYTDDLKADIYQAESNSNGVPVNPTGWEKITTAAPQTYETLSTDGFIKSSLTVGAYYVYRVVLTSTENTGKTFNVTSQSSAVRPSVAYNPSSFTWNPVATADSSVIYTSLGSATGDSDNLKTLLGAKVFVVEYDSTTYEYKKVASGLSATIDKAGSTAVGSVPAYKYFTSFTTADLNALNTGASKTYYLATEDVSGGFTSYFKSFSVANSVTTW